MAKSECASIDIPMLELGVLVSGSGSNLQAILDAIDAEKLDASVRLVVSNDPGAYALKRAQKARVPHCVLSHKHFPSREAFDQAMVDALMRAGVEWVALAGFMRLLSPTFLRAFPTRVLNIHPALLPAFPGIDAQQQALDRGVCVTGCTVHLVDEGIDTGPIVAQSVVRVHHDETRDQLAARIIRREHELYPRVLQWIAQGRVHIKAGVVRHHVYVEGVCTCVGVEEDP